MAELKNTHGWSPRRKLSGALLREAALGNLRRSVCTAGREREKCAVCRSAKPSRSRGRAGVVVRGSGRLGVLRAPCSHTEDRPRAQHRFTNSSPPPSSSSLPLHPLVPRAETMSSTASATSSATSASSSASGSVSVSSNLKVCHRFWLRSSFGVRRVSIPFIIHHLVKNETEC